MTSKNETRDEHEGQSLQNGFRSGEQRYLGAVWRPAASKSRVAIGLPKIYCEEDTTLTRAGTFSAYISGLLICFKYSRSEEVA